MKFKVFALSLAVALLILSGCTEKKKEEDPIEKIYEIVLQEENPGYKLVEPQWEELQLLSYDLDVILSMFHKDYDCTKDNIYEYLFNYTHLGCVYSQDSDVKFQSEPFQRDEQYNYRWSLYDVPQRDPLGKFPEIPQELFDENGNIDKYVAYEYYENSGVPWREMCIGYNKFTGEYIDWLVEDLWNGKIDHETSFEFKDDTSLYYHDGYYYTPSLAGWHGGGGVFYVHIENLIPLENNLYNLEYHLTDDNSRCESHNTAIIGLKEKDDGSRFWSIFSIDYNYTGNKFDY